MTALVDLVEAIDAVTVWMPTATPSPRRYARGIRRPELTFSADSMRTYLKQIGKVVLLNAEQEVGLAKRIEVGLYAAERVRRVEDATDNGVSVASSSWLRFEVALQAGSHKRVRALVKLAIAEVRDLAVELDRHQSRPAMWAVG